MSDYTRATRACDFSQLSPEVVAALRQSAAARGASGFDTDVSACCETHSIRKRKGFFGGGGDPDPEHTTSVVLTSRWLLWVRRGPKSGIVTSIAVLKEIELEDLAARLTGDTGLEVFGFVNQSAEKVHAFIGLGAEPAALGFRRAVQDALARARA